MSRDAGQNRSTRWNKDWWSRRPLSGFPAAYSTRWWKRRVHKIERAAAVDEVRRASLVEDTLDEAES